MDAFALTSHILHVFIKQVPVIIFFDRTKLFEYFKQFFMIFFFIQSIWKKELVAQNMSFQLRFEVALSAYSP